MRAFSLRKTDRIRKHWEFLTISSEGSRIGNRSFIAIVNDGMAQGPRVGLTVSKKVGDAVKRNRIKRLIRTRFRLEKNRFQFPVDIVVITKKEAGKLTNKQIDASLKELFERIRSVRER